MKLLLVSIVFFCVFSSAFALKCYQCDYNKSGDLACNHPKQVVCQRGLEMCLTWSVSHRGTRAVSKSCSPKCSQMKYSTNILGVETKFGCCRGNLCNSSEHVYSNKILFSAVVVYAISKVFL